MVYNKFKNAATQIVTTEQFLPIVPSADGADANQDYIFEPSKAEIVETLIPKSLKTQLFKQFVIVLQVNTADDHVQSDRQCY